MKVLRVLRGGTRNQSTADFSRQSLFVSGNRYYDGTLINLDAAPLTAEEGILVKRDATDPTRFCPILLEADLPKVIGVLNISGEVVLNQNETASACYAHSGDIDAELLVLPTGVTMNTIVGDETLKDLLTGRGFHLLNVAENSKFDN